MNVVEEILYLQAQRPLVGLVVSPQFMRQLEAHCAPHPCSVSYASLAGVPLHEKAGQSLPCIAFYDAEAMRRYLADWGSHPVDLLRLMMREAGVAFPVETERELRAHCDEEVELP